MRNAPTPFRIHSRCAVGAAALFIAATLPSAAAAQTVALFNTGVDAAGALLPGGSIDPHFQVVSGPGITAPVAARVLTSQSPLGTYVQSPLSRWIWVNADGVAGFNSPYAFELQIDLTGVDPQTVTVSGRWAVDNLGSMLLNGATPVGSGEFTIPTATGFTSLHPFTITGGFIDGLNRLDFVVTDVGLVGGLDVTDLVVGVSAVPEAPALASAMAGLATMAFMLRRRRRER